MMNNKEEELQQKKLIFLDNEEKEFWKNVFITALNSNIQDDAYKIADYGVFHLRERITQGVNYILPCAVVEIK